MKRITKKQSWELCMPMWKKISKLALEAEKRGEDFYVIDAKEEYITNLGYAVDNINANCFFCEYDTIHVGNSCEKCPGILIDPNFGCCKDVYNYEKEPRKFYAELKRLYKIYLAETGGK